MKVKYKIGVLILILLIQNNIVAQMLSKEQMLEDISYLDSIIKTSYPQYELREKYTGIDISGYNKKMYAYVNNNSLTEEEFVYIIHNILTYTQDYHNRISLASEIDPALKKLDLKNFSDTSILEIYGKRYSQYYSYISQNTIFVPYYFPVRYIDGDYYFSLGFKYKGKKYKSGARIVSFNNKQIDEIVVDNLDNLEAKYDAVKHKYYSERFYLAHKEILNKDTIYLKVKTSEDEQDIIITNNHELRILKKPWIVSRINGVTYFKKERILHIRLHMLMSPLVEKYIIEKLADFKNKEIKKIIVDFRGNPGGSDILWINILNAIIDKPIKLNTSISVGVKDIEKGNQFYSENLYMPKVHEKYPFLDNTGEMMMINWDSQLEEYLKPDSNSLNYSGKIYLVQDRDIFSSATALSSLGRYSDRFVVIGEENGCIGGVGETPIPYVLPNSKILFQITSTLDKTLVKNDISDYFNKVDIEVKYTIEDFYERDKQVYNLYSKRFLRKRDPVFKKILNLD